MLYESSVLLPMQHKKDSVVQDGDYHKSLFTSHLMLETNKLYFEPSGGEFRTGLSEILGAFRDCTLAFPNLLPDSYFHSFTRYV